MSVTSRRWDRIIAHADMDAFYATIEQLDDPSLRGKPVLVGPPSGRGVVLTASYEARPFKVGSAMPMAKAKQLCPQAIIVPPRFGRYQAASETIMEVFADFAPNVEALSLDEAFLDMSGSEHMFGSPRQMAARIKSAVFEATGGLTVSVGVSGTKYVAKVGSGYQKPDGLTVVPPWDAQSFLAPLPVQKLWGAGPKTCARLHDLGLYTIGDVAEQGLAFLRENLGSAGDHFFHLAHAQDPRHVSRGRSAKSVGSEQTLGSDVSTKSQIERHLRRSADNIARRLRRKRIVAFGVRVKLKTVSFQLLSRQVKLTEPTDVADEMFRVGAELLDGFEFDEPFRLVGMAAFDLHDRDDPVQLDLFSRVARARRLESTLDQITDRFGSAVIRRAEDLAEPAGMRLAPNLDFMDDSDP